MAPVGVQPLKPDGFSTGFSDRLAMVELAAAADPSIVPSAIDAPRNDGKPNYTIDVLTSIKHSLPPGDALFFLLGADAFLALKQWQGAARLPFLCDFIVAGRPGFSMGDVPATLPPGISAEPEHEADDSAEVITWRLLNDAGERSHLYLMPDLHEDISATHIRDALAGEESAEGVLSPAVLRYIRERGLYR